jgi:hypothetical protein
MLDFIIFNPTSINDTVLLVEIILVGHRSQVGWAGFFAHRLQHQILDSSMWWAEKRCPTLLSGMLFMPDLAKLIV